MKKARTFILDDNIMDMINKMAEDDERSQAYIVAKAIKIMFNSNSPLEAPTIDNKPKVDKLPIPIQNTAPIARVLRAPITDNQRETLKRLTYEGDLNELSKAEASNLIDKLKKDQGYLPNSWTKDPKWIEANKPIESTLVFPPTPPEPEYEVDEDTFN